jgi:hypothetical protein
MGSSSGLGSSGVDRDGYKPGATGQHVGTDGQIGYAPLILSLSDEVANLSKF